MMLPTKVLVVSSIAFALAGCSALDTRQADRAPARSGGYYKDDGPGDRPPADLAAIPDATPRAEPRHRAANRPYVAFGKEYLPMVDAGGFRQRGLASWYGRRYHGQRTSSGEPYDMYAMTAAHPTLPIPSYARVTNPANGRSVVVRINDRGPFHADRIIDLSYTAAWKLDLLRGVTPVEVAALDPAVPPAALTSDPAAATWLQLGAFASAGAAEHLGRQVRQRLGESLPGIEPLPVGSLVKLQVGPFATLAEADRAAQALEQATGIRPYRVSR